MRLNGKSFLVIFLKWLCSCWICFAGVIIHTNQNQNEIETACRILMTMMTFMIEQTVCSLHWTVFSGHCEMPCLVGRVKVVYVRNSKHKWRCDERSLTLKAFLTVGIDISIKCYFKIFSKFVSKWQKKSEIFDKKPQISTFFFVFTHLYEPSKRFSDLGSKTQN